MKHRQDEVVLAGEVALALRVDAMAIFVPGAIISAIQAVLLVVVLDFVVGIDPASRPLLMGMAFATGITFTAINQMFVGVFGGGPRRMRG